MTDEHSGLRIFVSYRRGDAPVNAGRIADNLEFRKVGVFLDTAMAPGADFAQAIEEEIESCDAVLAVIGRNWVDAPGRSGGRALDDPGDWVHTEIRLALERGAPIFPILVDGARMPTPDQLPETLWNLALRNAVELRRDTWRADFEHLFGALPRPQGERLEPSTEESVPEWPARFTDAWFRDNVPQMSEAQLRQLRAKLYERNWTDDEIRDRVMVHSQLAGEAPRGALPPAEPTATEWKPPETVELEGDDPVGRATERAVLDLAELGRDPGARIVERTLANALAASLQGGIAERRVAVPGWSPEPGNVDVLTKDWRGRPNLVIETKLKDDERLLEVLWDAPKLLSIARQDFVDGVYLVVGSTASNWNTTGIGTQFLETGRHALVPEIEHHHDYWARYVLGDSAGRPLAVPEEVDVTRVARVAFDMRGQRWEVRAARLHTPPDTPWRRFQDGLPQPAD
jgi:hypothetical protein